MNRKSLILYVIVFIVAFVVFGLVRFPAGKAGAFLTEMVNSSDSNIRCQVGKAGIRLPLALNLKEVEILLNNEVEILPDRVRIGLNPMSLFKSPRPLGIRADLYQGKLDGRVLVDSVKPLVLKGTEFTLTRAQVRGFKYHTPVGDITLDCDISGKFANKPDQEGGSAKSGMGKGNLLIEGVSAQLENSWLNVISFPKLDFTLVTADYVLHSKKIGINQITAKGPSVNIQLKGDIRFGSQIKKARLNLTGKILPDSPYLAQFANQAAIRSKAKNIPKNGIDFYIKGTLDKPKIGL